MSYGNEFSFWSSLLFLYLSPELKHRVRGCLTSKSKYAATYEKEIKPIDCWLFSLIALTENVPFVEHWREVVKSIEKFVPERDDSAGRRAPQEIMLSYVKQAVLRLFRDNNVSFSTADGQINFEKNMGNVKSYAQLKNFFGTSLGGGK
ncbi:hypothetical protein DASC09_043050 [Saccharomycopsis crataegensis]|uniref:Uncharacterized protein n=1 Tax=Saccharomycopsis crataegensis TaxID=43959 RepID=A0AAV5QRR7_9ASCO|nr:hypothetical protein DASC09_043050 [Saccharomycopsis crataegensis]